MADSDDSATRRTAAEVLEQDEESATARMAVLHVAFGFHKEVDDVASNDIAPCAMDLERHDTAAPRVFTLARRRRGGSVVVSVFRVGSRDVPGGEPSQCGAGARVGALARGPQSYNYLEYGHWRRRGLTPSASRR